MANQTPPNLPNVNGWGVAGKVVLVILPFLLAQAAMFWQWKGSVTAQINSLQSKLETLQTTTNEAVSESRKTDARLSQRLRELKTQITKLEVEFNGGK